MKEFGTYTNLILTLAVTVFGVYWLFKPLSRSDYRYRAYLYWWCSWLAWVIAWSLILVQQNTHRSLEIPILIFDNLNSIFLITVYFVLTRGRELSPRQAQNLTIRIALSLAVAFASFYLFFGLVTGRNILFAYEIHRTCSLCISVLTPILVGWAFNIRFRTSTALIVGCVYGFVQPIVYATELSALGQGVFDKPLDPSACVKILDQARCEQFAVITRFHEGLESIRPVVAMVVGFLKVVWAITCTKVLSSAYAGSSNLIRVEKASKPFHFMERWWRSVALHATVLIAIYVGLLVWLGLLYIKYLVSFGTAVGAITGVVSLWKLIWSVWRTTSKSQPSIGTNRT